VNIDCLEQWLSAGVAPVSVVLGPWTDGPGMEAVSFLSVNLDGGAPPGPASRYTLIDLWYASPMGWNDELGGRLRAHRQAQAIEDFLVDLKPARPFSNVKTITGIIGPKIAEGGRVVYKMTVEITS